VALNIISNGSPQSRTVVLTLAPLNSSSHMSALTSFTYAIIAEGSDADNDGLPDGWEWQYANSFTNIDPSADEDSDGMINLAEYSADTDPANSNSFLRITDIQTVPEGIRVEWMGGTNAWQYVECAPSPELQPDAWTTTAAYSPPTPIISEIIHTSAATTSFYFRIKAARP
jgi:hypothetical protein